jgi:hypothetical protein
VPTVNKCSTINEQVNAAHLNISISMVSASHDFALLHSLSTQVETNKQRPLYFKKAEKAIAISKSL